ncbi:inorganic pyrophosphatase [Candidatus Mycoplasma haematolamae str. Purdue]|uniref:inorganic diphosphatase n=1 Tax=Mycoplasma haematolamae (strain Purdue) TaxID=1212765 RepID=I7CGI2_MYCHA|nr:inorganic diphosphatase [Candidatus Mycoplasma haematolamae]AFO52376.1 inorganic pyrophosphatase [Candidatus Mycoplasma haematolamae str. Purdue]
MSSKVYECFIEIAKGSNIKYELTDIGLKLDRVLFGSAVYPQNYGFIVHTLGEDQDPLDVVLVSNFALTPGTYADARIVGSLEMVDTGEQDLKVLAIMEGDPRLGHIQALEDIPQHLLDELRDFFKSYKTLEKKEVQLGKFLSLEETVKHIEAARKRYNASSR